MSLLSARFDDWVQSGPFTSLDLARYRIIYCVVLLSIAPQLTWLAPYPDSFLNPPPGPLRSMTGFPSYPVLVGIEIGLRVLLVLTLFGMWTRVSSVLLTVTMIAAYGLTYSVGKIDHGMIMFLVPLVMSFTGWGDRLSVDALRRQAVFGDPAKEPVAKQWPLRWYALAIGLAFVTAALPKLLGGWLSFSSQASYGYQVRSDFASNRHSWFSDALVNLHFPPLWELIDWTTVALEGLVVICVLSWRAWRWGLAVLALFHLGIGLSLGIWFVGNMIAYGAFVSWSLVRLPHRELSDRSKALFLRFCLPLAVVLALAAWWVSGRWPDMNGIVDAAVVIVGTGIAIFFLVSQIRSLLSRRFRRSSAASSES